MTINFRTWARGTAGTSLVSFYTATQGVDGYDSATAAWPDGVIHYLIQSGVKWELGIGELYSPGFLEEEPGGPPAPVKHMTRRAVTQNSAGTAAFIDFGGELCDVAFSHSTLTPYPRWWELYGDGSDGDVTLSGAVTLTRSMFYRNLTLAADAVVTTAGFAIHVRDRLTLPDSRSTALPVFEAAAGATGDTTAQVAGFGGFGAQYFGSPPGNPAGVGDGGGGAITYRLGGAGGDGGSGQSVAGVDFWNFGASGGTGGGGRTLPAWLGPADIEAVVGGGAAGGGGGGGADSSGGFSTGGAGGNSGAGGSIVRIHARIIDGGAWAGAPLLLARAHGGAGSAGAIGTSGGGQGGDGGGGGGGALVIVADFINHLPWTFEANGGAPGGPGAYGGAGGAVYAWVGGA